MKTVCTLLVLLVVAVSGGGVGLWHMYQRVDRLETAVGGGSVAFPPVIVFRKSELYAPCIAVGDPDRENILWRDRARVLCKALNATRVRRALIKAYCGTNPCPVPDIKFSPEDHYPSTLCVIDGNEIWWREKVTPLLSSLNGAIVQAALREELRGVFVPLPEIPVDET